MGPAFYDGEHTRGLAVFEQELVSAVGGVQGHVEEGGGHVAQGFFIPHVGAVGAVLVLDLDHDDVASLCDLPRGQVLGQPGEVALGSVEEWRVVASYFEAGNPREPVWQATPFPSTADVWSRLEDHIQALFLGNV